MIKGGGELIGHKLEKRRRNNRKRRGEERRERELDKCQDQLVVSCSLDGGAVASSTQ